LLDGVSKAKGAVPVGEEVRAVGELPAQRGHQVKAGRPAGIATGVANLFLAPPDSLAYSATTGRWSVAPAWAALTRAQQDAATLAFAQQAVRNPDAMFATQNDTPAPAIISRPPRTSERFGGGKTMQAELVGNYDFGWAKLKPLIGAVHTKYDDYDRAYQRPGNAFRTWDVNPASPSYFIDPNTPSYSARDLTARNRFTRSETKDEGLYGILNGRFLRERLLLVAGARYNRSESQTANLNVTPSTLDRLTGTSTTPQIGAGYLVTPSLLLYGSYSTSYTLPTQPFLTQPGVVNGLVVAVPTGPTQPTEGEGVEAGVKTSFLSGRVSATVSVFEINQNKVVQSLNQTISGIGVNIIVQGAKVRSQGVEAEVTWSPTDNWQVYASASDIDARLVQVPFGLTYYLNQVPNHTARNTANLWTRYTFKTEPAKGLWLGGGFNYTGKSAGDSRNVDFYMPTYTLWNAALGYDWKWNKRPMKTVLNARNLAGKHYKATTAAAGEPRRITLSFSTEF
jgi:outer membrane receptor protein involved in Fe transport